MPEIRNPNLDSQGPGGSAPGGDFRSIILFTFLALAAVMVFQYFKKPETNQPASNRSKLSRRNSRTRSHPPAIPASATSGNDLAGHALPRPTASIAAPSETTTTIENEKFRITFTNKGAQVQHWILKGFTDSTGKPLDMVQEQAAARFGLPLSLYTYDNALTNQLNTALYQPSATGQVLAPNSVIVSLRSGRSRCGEDLQLRHTATWSVLT